MQTIEEAKAPSPFFEGSKLQFAWDSTSLGALKKCPRYYELSILEGWRAKSESVHLTFGIHFHKALELYDKHRFNGMDYDDAVDAVLEYLLKETYGWKPDHNFKTRENLIRSVIWYFEEYKNDVAKTVMLEDGSPAVELSFKFESGIGNYVLCGHMDRLVTFSEDMFVMDRKTSGTTMGAYFFNQFNPDNQMTLYTLAGKVVYNAPISGVMIDGAQIAVGFTAFSRGITMRSEGQLAEWIGDFSHWMAVAELYVQKGHWPMNEASCGNYGGCTFRGICGKDPKVRELFLKTDFERRFWNPLEIR